MIERDGGQPQEHSPRDAGAMQVGEYTVSAYGDDFWIENSAGEGMQVFKLNFERLVGAYFKSEF